MPKHFVAINKTIFGVDLSFDRAFFIGDRTEQIRLSAVGFGGDGGGALSATVGGGGGGSGDYFDEVLDVEPNSYVLWHVPYTVAGGWGAVTISYLPRGTSIMTSFTLLPGDPGTFASGSTAGLGGDSGAGGEGGTLTSVDTRIGTGFVGADNLAHSCGGQAGWGASFPSSKKLDYTYTRSSTGLIQRVKNKWPNCAAAVYNGMGGLGGVSFFGPNGKFGAGGNGGDAGLTGSSGGGAFIMIEEL